MKQLEVQREKSMLIMVYLIMRMNLLLKFKFPSSVLDSQVT